MKTWKPSLHATGNAAPQPWTAAGSGKTISGNFVDASMDITGEGAWITEDCHNGKYAFSSTYPDHCS